ncbi:MAG TPA: peptide-methionine (S)-S-oxide reductase MsrA [Geopsychrobacteraceae bacterium]|nr:peptide-methionine (S)-S-oxide reductase MsrA [Geopsychrobacteraceae bacterium]
MNMNRWLFLSITLIGLALLVPAMAADKMPMEEKMAEPMNMQRAIFAGGCFWCMEYPFEKLDGVSEVISGYTGGQKENPTYKEVSAGETGHTEAVEVHYDPTRVSYEQLLNAFWMSMDPTDADGQFVDRGTQYRPGIYPLNEEQMKLAVASREKLDQSGRFDEPIATEIVPAGEFYPAEKYHQDYYKKNPIRYKYYRYGSGRDQFLDKVWGKDRDH